MAAKRSYFDVPDWGEIDSNIEHLSEAVFQSIPSSSVNKRRKTDEIDGRENSEKRKKKSSKTGSLVWSKEYDEYLNSLEPEERIRVLFNKLQKNRSKSKEFNDVEKDKKSKKRKIGKQSKAQHAVAGADIVKKEISHNGEGKGVSGTFDVEKLEKVIEINKGKSKKKVKPHSIKEIDSRLVKEDGCEVLEIQKDCSPKLKKKTRKMHNDKGSKTLIRKEKGGRDIYKNLDTGPVESGPVESTGRGNFCDSSTEVTASKIKKNKSKTGRGENQAANTTVDQHTMVLQTGSERILETDLHASSKDSNKRNVDFKAKLQKKLNGAQFRWINEQLYTVSSDRALDMFSSNPSLFDVYHRGFQSQVKLWPQNPIDMMIKDLENRSDELIVADMGCGEAKIAQSVKQKVYSFDLVAQNKFTVACDMSQVPLGDASVDMVIFCLSLMGKNIADFLCEANRILKTGGVLKIAEVVSRFDGVKKFIKNVCTFGFSFLSKDTTNKMFILMDFEKKRLPSSIACLDISLKPCLYKKR